MNKIILRSFRIAFPKAVKTGWLLLRMILPISLGVRLLDYYGLLNFLAGYISPVFEWIGLSGNTAIVFLTSIFLPLYAPLAIMTSMAITMREATILAIMCLVSHNMPVECAIQRKTGSSFAGMFLLRVIMSLIMAFVLHHILPTDGWKPWVVSTPVTRDMSVPDLLEIWFFTSVRISFLIISVITALMMLQRIMLEYKILDNLIKPIRPVMRLMGLPENTGFLWMIGNIVGLSYGGAIMVEEVKEGRISKEDCNLLNHHLAISHSLLEDTLIFVAVGVSAGWIIITRVFFAIAVVWGARMILHFRAEFANHRLR